MHLAELLARRPVPAAAVFLAITRRCPLRCAHCSTMSEATSPQQPAALLQRFVESFSLADHPEFVLITGGEPLLRPRLVAALARAARCAGTRSYVLTGAFFARSGRTPAAITAALESADHVAVSIDRFHEAEVPRPQAFRVLHDLLAAGRDVSIQACGTGPGDPYLAALTDDVRREFGARVPMLVTAVLPVGRGRAWLPGPPALGAPAAAGGPGPIPPAAPCDLAAWPVVGFDGTITACCNQDVLDTRPVPEHLRLGHIASQSWPEVRRRCVSSPVLRALRTRGPRQLAHRLAGPGQPPAGATYCGTCRFLPGTPAGLRALAAEADQPAARLIEEQALALQLAAGPVSFARRHGDPTRAEQILSGLAGPPPGAA
ncbi:MAG TPA: radical SAM protein [Streptosporangiaceae bacterium]|nr:radical SAM protein [Streptosporangiaceae bacterium]